MIVISEQGTLSSWTIQLCHSLVIFVFMLRWGRETFSFHVLVKQNSFQGKAERGLPALIMCGFCLFVFHVGSELNIVKFF